MQHTRKWDHCYAIVVVFFHQENQTKPKTKSPLTSRRRCLMDKVNEQPLKGFDYETIEHSHFGRVQTFD